MVVIVFRIEERKVGLVRPVSWLLVMKAAYGSKQ